MIFAFAILFDNILKPADILESREFCYDMF